MTDAPIPPLPFIWDGEAFRPLSPHFAKRCDEHFVIGKRYQLVEHNERSVGSHNHYFAALHEAWLNLPEAMAEQFPTVEHLRKFALIKCGFYDSESVVLANKAEALRVASFCRPKVEFAIVVVTECTVTRYTAKSQSQKAMGRADFQKSKEAVLAYVWGLIGVDPETGAANAGQAA